MPMNARWKGKYGVFPVNDILRLQGENLCGNPCSSELAVSTTASIARYQTSMLESGHFS